MLRFAIFYEQYSMRDIFEKLKTYWKFVVFAIIAAFAGGIFYIVSHPSNQETAENPSNLTVSSSTKAEKSSVFSTSSKMMVDIKGEIRHPNVYEMPAGSRLSDLIKLAGGFTDKADQKAVNLAQKLKDEQEIVVPAQGENPPSNLTTSAGSSSSQEKVNINTADLTTLQTISGIGAKKAQDIIDYRTQNGPFQSVDDLGKVKGFGQKTVDKLKDFVTVD